MKIKYCFITNSSSASFILYVRSSTNDEYTFFELWKKYLEKYLRDDEWDTRTTLETLLAFFQIQQIHDSNYFKIVSYTPMLNSIVNDVPKQFIKLIIQQNINKNTNLIYGFEEVTLEIKED